MSTLFDSQIQVQVRINKTSGKFTVTITDHGEKIGCTEMDANGESLNAKIVKYISEQISSTPVSDPQLTKKGEMEVRQGATTFNPLEEDQQEEEEGYNPLNDTPSKDPYDIGSFGI